MDEQDENLGIVQFEYESQRERLNEPTGATGANSGCALIIGLLISLGILAMVCVWLIIPS